MSIPGIMFSKLFTVLLLWLLGFPRTVRNNVVLQGRELDSLFPKDWRKQKDGILGDFTLLQLAKTVRG